MTDTYLKLSTMEYPRYIGDIQLDGNNFDDYAPLIVDTLPELDFSHQRYTDSNLLLVDGQWHLSTGTREATEEEIADALAKINAQTPAA